MNRYLNDVDDRDALIAKLLGERDSIRESVKFVSGQLRHAYMKLASGSVVDQRMFAKGLVSPQISKLEEISKILDA